MSNHEELHNYVLLGPLVFATLKFLIHEIHVLKHFELEIQSNLTTFQDLGKFGNLVPEFFLRLREETLLLYQIHHHPHHCYQKQWRGQNSLEHDHCSILSITTF